MGITRMAVEVTWNSNTLRLTNREAEVLCLLSQGMSSKQVASELFCSKRTVDYHISHIYEKLEVSNRIQAVHRAASLGLANSPAL